MRNNREGRDLILGAQAATIEVSQIEFRGGTVVRVFSPSFPVRFRSDEVEGLLVLEGTQ